MGGLLQAGLRSDWAPEFLASLPIVAVDGTMRRRLKDSPAAGRARMKTGTLNERDGDRRLRARRQRPAVRGGGDDQRRQQGNGKGRAVLDALVDWVARRARTRR